MAWTDEGWMGEGYIDYSGEGVGAPSSLSPTYWKNIYEGIQSGGIPADWQPRMANIPSFEDWLAQQNSWRGPDNQMEDPYGAYLGEHYQMPSNSSGFGRMVGSALTPGINPNGRTYLDPINESYAEATGGTPHGPSLDTTLATQLAIAAVIGGGAGAAAGLWGAGAGGAAGGSAAFVPAEGLGGIGALGETSLAADSGFGLLDTAVLGSDWTAATAGAGGLSPAASNAAGFAGSVGGPFATGAEALPAWAETAGVTAAGGAAVGSTGAGGSSWDKFVNSMNGGNIAGAAAGGGFDLLGTGLRMAPSLAAINYARNVDPFDTSMLRADYASIDPNSLAFPYDIESGKGRGRLTSSLTQRGVMGSSFANQDLSTYDTMRGLGRQNLLTQGAIARSGISNQILQAQIAEREQKNRLYGSALLALSGGLNPRQSLLDQYLR